MARRKVIIMGAAGRDFHNFNTFYRDNVNYEVVAFTATQIPDIEGRCYPTDLSGSLYPDGIPIHAEEDLGHLIQENNVDEVVLAYSDLPYETVMDKASIVNANGADFALLGPKYTMLKSQVPIISICAVRTGCGKSQTTRKVIETLKKQGHKVVVIRHPMPYGDLRDQICQRFETLEDLDKHKCTIEEREEYEPHIVQGTVVYAGVDYEKIIREAEKEADIIVWDGGNNDFSFYKSKLYIVIADPHRAGHETSYYPGSTNLRMANVAIINKVDSAEVEDIELVRQNIKKLAPNAQIIDAESPITIEDPEMIRNKRVLVVEDGPTLTHGDMPFGAGSIAADMENAEKVDPRPNAVGSIKETFKKYVHLGAVLPAMGYGEKQLSELEQTIAATDCEAVVIGTPIDLRRIIKIHQPATRVIYELKIVKGPSLEEILAKF
ncbi:MAG: cyclic 2,3-diphosphoglycerate synthase [Promethearchaeota archaeon]